MKKIKPIEPNSGINWEKLEDRIIEIIEWIEDNGPGLLFLFVIAIVLILYFTTN